MVGFNIMGTQKNVPKNEEENKTPLFHLEIWFPPLHKGGEGWQRKLWQVYVLHSTSNQMMKGNDETALILFFSDDINLSKNLTAIFLYFKTVSIKLIFPRSFFLFPNLRFWIG